MARGSLLQSDFFAKDATSCRRSTDMKNAAPPTFIDNRRSPTESRHQPYPDDVPAFTEAVIALIEKAPAAEKATSEVTA